MKVSLTKREVEVLALVLGRWQTWPTYPDPDRTQEVHDVLRSIRRKVKAGP